MRPEQIERINALAQKSKMPQGLTPEELAEQAALRGEYLAAVRNNLKAQLALLRGPKDKRPKKR